ncbi:MULTISPECIES: restriction endonuclease subunit S [Providencia]|uniref:restriction endonuclease subunit S n=1 Tax=Providencia TaxID=586 RepID=UPI0015D5411C|nr:MULTISPECIES: restriction endonuclease subunit S [Providencia]MBN6366795.1 restriction endonuclease subunit S [Providencia rettgeri]MDH2379713.1 restriction endonuclease subunit S [Providencia rettgeri]QLI98855.1 restriction endonuclease subunit S [Providencia rettgeri]
MTVEKLITDHIDIWSSALQTRSTAGRGNNGKIDLYGIKKLRELILELAVRGKLVPQDPNDEPASELLKRIAAEKAELMKQGKIRKQKPLPEISENEKPFELPEGWEWVRFGNIYEMEYGNNLPQEKRTNTGEYNVYGSNGVVGTHNVACVNSPCIVIGRKGSAGALNLSLNIGCWVTDVAYSSIPPMAMNLDFVFMQFHTLGLDSLGKGIKPGLNRNDAYGLTIAIPPQNEQENIVLKVKELMALCDQLEQQSLTSLDAHKKLVETLLATLTDSQNAKELSENWSRISQHFDTLFTTETSIDTLKQTILQLAVMGKLVPQDPNNEPASELVRRIEQEKAQMVKDGKIKKQKPLPPISDEEKPFELPMGWEWCRLGTLFNFQNGYAFKSEWFSDNGIRLVRNANISHGHINWADSVKLPDSRLSEFEGFSLNVGDIVISLDRPIINTGLKYAFIRECDLPCLLLQRVAKFSSIGNMILSGFLSKWLESNYFINAIDPGRSNGVPHISTKQLEMTLFPLLSQNEQDKIISKANELIQVCEHLKSRLQSAQQTQLHLANALTEAALS